MTTPPSYIVDGDGHVIEPGGIFGPAQRADHNPITVSPNTPFEACGGADLAEQWESGWSAVSYLHAMDAQGIDAAVLYPSVGLFVPYQDGITVDEHLRGARATTNGSPSTAGTRHTASRASVSRPSSATPRVGCGRWSGRRSSASWE